MIGEFHVCTRKISHKEAYLFTLPLPRPQPNHVLDGLPVKKLSIPIQEELGYRDYPAWRLWMIKGVIVSLAVVQLALLLMLIVGINNHQGVMLLAGRRMSVELLGQLNLVFFLATLVITMLYCLFYRT